MPQKFLLRIVLVLISLSACTSLEKRLNTASQLAQKSQFQDSPFPTSSFTLYGLKKIQAPQRDTVHIYIEGDGLAWRRPNAISPDPTPLNPVGLKLSSQDPFPNVAYIARPCQYLKSHNPSLCQPEVWTHGRYRETAISAINQAIDQLVKTYTFKKIYLFGYSGGAGIAALIAVRRPDVVHLITIAGNIDHKSWTHHHRISPLSSSLDPMQSLRRLKEIPQTHFVGDQDDIVPPELTKGYLQKLEAPKLARLIVVPNQGHEKRWPDKWPQLLGKIP